MRTVPVAFNGTRLAVNADIAADGGELQVGLVDARTGESIPGYGLAQATPLRGDGVAQLVQWGKQSDVRALQGRPVQLDFRLRRCKLYAFQFVRERTALAVS